MTYAIEQHLVELTVNPFGHMLIKADKKPKKTVAQDDIARCLAYLTTKMETEEVKHFYYPCGFWITLIKVLQSTGIRRNQLLHVRICDINTRHQSLFLRSEGSKNHIEREVPLLDDVYHALLILKRQLMQLNKKPEMQLFNVYNFKNTKCDHYKEMDFNRIDKFFQRLSKACGVRISPHRFRHTLATDLMKSPDRNVTLVKELLGHSSITTTLEYIATDQDQLRHCLVNYFKQ